MSLWPVSTQSPVIDVETLQLGRDYFATKLYFVSMTTLYVYDYLLTLSDEIRYAWVGWNLKWSPIFLLFLANRYIPFTFALLVNLAWHSSSWTQDICNQWAYSQQLYLILVTVVSMIIMLFRVYAVSKKNWLVQCTLIPVMLALAGVGLYTIVNPGNTGSPFIGDNVTRICLLVPPHLPLIAVILELGLVFHGLIFLFTAYYTVSAARSRYGSRLMVVMLRDGAISFLIIFLSILIWHLLLSHGRPGLRSIQAEAHVLLTSLLMNRLILSLKKAGAAGNRKDWGIHTFESPEDWAVSPADRNSHRPYPRARGNTSFPLNTITVRPRLASPERTGDMGLRFNVEDPSKCDITD